MQQRINEINKELEGYKDVIKTIDALKKERAKLEKQLLQSLPFEKRFDKFLGTLCRDLFELESTRISKAILGYLYDCNLSQLKNNLRLLIKQGYTVLKMKY